MEEFNLKAESGEKRGKFSSREEASAWLRGSLTETRNDQRTLGEYFVNEEKQTQLEKDRAIPRSEFTIALEFLSKYKTQLNQLEADEELLAQVKPHDGYTVDDSAPDEIKAIAAERFKSAKSLAVSLAYHKQIFDDLNSGRSFLHQELTAYNNDSEQDKIKTVLTEIEMAKIYFGQRITEFEEAIELVQDQTKWEAALLPKAEIVKRILTLKERLGEMDKDDLNMDQSVEDLREMGSLLDYCKSERIAMSNPDIELFLYLHPETIESTRFEPS